jgi:class 3 adenylate cyclase/predicted ATPase
MDIGGWLRNLGLGKYGAAFCENDIDETVLPSLTHENLKELGVASLGHRVKLLDAIAALGSDASGKALSVNAATASSAPSAHSEDRAERRQVTVMFCDLVGSTALSARMDPEDLREVISAYQKCVADTVGRFGGFVAKYMGDGALVYFGYPQAHEDDAERAVRAGLEFVSAVGQQKTHVHLQTRVGIATGLVVVGDLIGSGEAQERGIVGETPNLAARLQGVAEPNSVVIAESTRKLVGNLFELDDLGAQDLKGTSGPVRAWAASRPASIESRFDALHATGLTELVGREEEFELLLRRWSKAKSGQGQLVLLSGEPGIGKSRLTVVLMERLANEPHTRLRYFCSPQHTDSALYPIINQMERAAGFSHDDAAQAKLDKLDALLARSSTARDAALVAEMLSLPNDGRYPTLELAPQQRRQKTLEALTAQLEALSRSKPVLMIFEDVHWVDPTSLEALGRIVDRIATLPALLIVTFRPEFAPSWIGQPHVTPLTINRFAQREANSLIDCVIGHNRLPASIRHDIIERTDGIPLFVEEMTKAVLEARSESDAQRTVAAVPSSASTVPASLYASLTARLDRLGAAKDLAQIGAAIGREFSYVLLSAVARWPQAELEAALDRLVQAGLLFQRGAPPHVTYLFKHALVQDAAYGMLLRDQRRALHGRIAETLTSQFAEIPESQPELLARHYTEAGLIEKAAGLWGKAGQRSLECSALVEAAEQLRRALAQIELLPATPALRREQIKLQVALIAPLIHVSGHVAPETKAAKERARQLIEQAEALGEGLEDPLLLFSVLFGFWAASFVAFDGKVLCELAGQFLALAEKQKATTPLIIGHRVMSSSLLFAGEIAKSLPHVKQALALYDTARHSSLATRFGVDPRVAVVGFRSWALWLLGYPEAALNDAWRALRDAREIDQAATLMFALNVSSMTHILRGTYTTALRQIAEVIALADEKNTLFWKALGMILQGSALALSGNSSMAVHVITSGISSWRSTGATLFMPFILLHLARAYAELGQMAHALRCIDEAMTAVETTNEKWCEAELARMAGEIALISDQPDAARAEALYQRALSIARQQQARSWELRAAMSMTRLWRQQGKFQEAHNLLAPVFGWFTEGFDTPDLKEAKVLLDLCGRDGF